MLHRANRARCLIGGEASLRADPRFHIAVGAGLGNAIAISLADARPDMRIVLEMRG